MQDEVAVLEADRHMAALRWAFGLFLGIETIPFIVLFTLRYELDGWYVAPTVNQWMGASEAVLILISMWCVLRALGAVRRNQLYETQRHIKSGVVVGVAYMVLLIYEWSQRFVPVGTRFGETFYTTLGVSAFYTLCGLFALVAASMRAGRIDANEHKYWDVQSTAWYWMFQGIVAVLMYVYLYWI